jgi:hypothetical protein
MPSDSTISGPRSVLSHTQPSRRGRDGGVDSGIVVQTVALITNGFIPCGLRQLSVGDSGANGARDPAEHDGVVL